MAKFKAILGDLRGKIAGNVFSANRYGAYIRQKVTPVNPKTSYQIQIRDWMIGAAQYFSMGIDESQKDAWNNWAVNLKRTDQFGNPINYTGAQVFASVNINKRLTNTGLFQYLSNPPGSLEQPDGIQAMSWVGSEAGQTIAVTLLPDSIPDTLAVLFYISERMRPNQSYAKNFKFLTFATNVASPIALGVYAVLRVGHLSEGDRFAIKCRTINLESYLSSGYVQAIGSIGA